MKHKPVPFSGLKPQYEGIAEVHIRMRAQGPKQIPKFTCGPARTYRLKQCLLAQHKYVPNVYLLFQ